jgi:hypothetical protein
MALLILAGAAGGASAAFAGILQTVKDFGGAITSGQGLTSALIAAILLAVFRWVPNEWIQTVVGKFARGLGVICTLFMSRMKFTGALWNTIIEPFFIDLIDNTVATFIREFIAGLRHDNAGSEPKPLIEEPPPYAP